MHTSVPETNEEWFLLHSPDGERLGYAEVLTGCGVPYWIAELAVKPELWGRGYATYLLQSVIAHCGREDIALVCKSLHPQGLTDIQLRAWYERYGFVLDGDTRMRRPSA